MGAVRTSCMIASILLAAAFLSTSMAYLHVPQEVAAGISKLDLSPYQLIATLAIFYIVLGLFLEGISITVMSLPITLPLVLGAGFDPIWFGILFCVNMQVSFLSPPFGPAAFYLKSVTPPHITLIDIFRGFGPFICLQLIVLISVMFFPELTQNFHEFIPRR